MTPPDSSVDAKEICHGDAELHPETRVGARRPDHGLEKRGLREGGGRVRTNERGMHWKAKHRSRVGVECDRCRGDVRNAGNDITQPHFVQRLEPARKQDFTPKLQGEITVPFKQRHRNAACGEQIPKGRPGGTSADNDDRGGRAEHHA